MGQIKSVVAFFSVFFYLLIGITGLGSFVICQEADGSASLEFSQNGRCVDMVDMTVNHLSDGKVISSIQTSDSCGGCTDTPVLLSGLTSSLTAVKTFSVQDFSIAIPSATDTIANVPEFIQEQVWPNPPPNITGSLAFLKTVILLI